VILIKENDLEEAEREINSLHKIDIEPITFYELIGYTIFQKLYFIEQKLKNVNISVQTVSDLKILLQQ